MKTFDTNVACGSMLRMTICATTTIVQLAKRYRRSNMLTFNRGYPELHSCTEAAEDVFASPMVELLYEHIGLSHYQPAEVITSQGE